MRKNHSSKDWKKNKNKTPKNKPSLEVSFPTPMQNKKNVIENSNIQANDIRIGNSTIQNTNITNITTPFVFDFNTNLNQQNILDTYVERCLNVSNSFEKITFNQIWEKEVAVIEENTNSKELQRNNSIYEKEKDIDAISKEKFGERIEATPNKNLGKKILILGEAGSGKTTFLENSCKQLNNLSNYVVLFKRLKGISLQNEYIVNFHTTKECILVLDGLDEVSMPNAENFVNQLIENYPNLNIVVSCRSVHYKKDISQLKSFKDYTIRGFSHGEMERYLDKRLGENDNDFFEKCRSKNIISWHQSFYNPFIINVLCDYYLKHNQKIEDLENAYDYMIEEALKVRKNDTSGTDFTTLEERKTLKEQLSKIAFVLQVRHKNSVNSDEFKQIITDTKLAEDLLNFSSIIEKNENEWTFGEAKIQEFLAAKVLNEVKSFQMLKSIVSTDEKTLKNAWVNVATLFYAIKGGNEVIKNKFLAWLEDNNLSVLINLEQDIISKKDRFRIFKGYIEKCRKQSQTPYGILGGSFWELSNFINSSSDAMAWICNELKHENSFPILHVFAMILVDAKDFIFSENQQKKIKAKFLPFFEELPTEKRPDTFAEALMVCQSIMSREEWISVCNSLFNENGSHARDAAYKIILKFELQDDLAEHLIAPFLSSFQKKEDDVIDMNEGNRLKECISSISREDIILKLINLFEDKNQSKTIEFANKLLPLILNAATNIKKISDEFNERLVKVITKNLYFFNIKTDLQNKLEQLDLLDKIILIAALEERNLYLISRFYDTHFKNMSANQFEIKFKKSNPEERDWTNLLSCIDANNHEKAQELSNSIGITIPPLPIKPLSEDFKRKVLFEKATSMAEAQQIINELKNIHGKDILTKSDDKYTKYETVYEKYTHFNISAIIHEEYVDLNTIYDYLDKNWDWRSISEIKNTVKNEKLELTKIEIDFVKSWCDDYMYKRYFGKNTRTHGLNTVSFFTVKYGFKHYSQEIYEMFLRLSEISPIGNKTILQFINKEKLLPEDKVKEIVLSYLSELQGYTNYLEEYVYFVNYKKYKEALPLLLDILKKETYQDWSKIFEVALSFKATSNQLFDVWNNLHKENSYQESLLYKHLIVTNRQETIDFLKNRLQFDEHKSNTILLLVRAAEVEGLEQVVELFEQKGIENIPSFFDYREHRDWEYNTPEVIPHIVKILLFSSQLEEEDRFSYRSNFLPAYNALFRLSIIENGKYTTAIKKELNRNITLTERLNLLSKIPYFKKKYTQKYKWYSENTLPNVEKTKKDLLYYATQNKTYSLSESIEKYDLVKNGQNLKDTNPSLDGEHKIGIPIIPFVWTYYISSKTNLKDVFGNMWKEFKNGEIFRKHQ